MTNKEGVVDAGNGDETHTTKINTQSDSNASFLRAARAGNLDKVLEYLKGSIDINVSNANGLNALHLAAKEGHVPVVLELVKRGANVNTATKKGNTALHIASLAGQEEIVKILIRNGANANVQSQNGFTPLYMAAQENHDGVVKFLLANGANQSLATEDGFTPLAVALQQGHDKVVAVLLENDAKGRVRLPALHIAAKKDDCKAAALLLQNDHDPDVTSKSGFTPLHIAAHYGNENIGTLLLEKNADVNYSAKHQITPLHVAAKWGKSNMVTLLIDKGAKIDASTRDGLTPLHCAARSGHDQVVDLLLEKGAPITAKTKNGLAPLHMASQGDHVDSARILLYHKAPVDDVTVDYLTALHVAAHCGHVRVAKLLLDRKADPNARALNGFTPLHIACKKNRIKVVELLLKHGASIEATTESGLTPLHVASFMGCMNIVIYLIQHGANPDVPTVRGETPLHLAARANQSDIIRILLRNGAHVDASAREQQTPLHIAARLGNVDIVGLLLQHGAAVDAPTKDMYTALHIAAKEGQEEVASVLLDHGASLTATTKKGFTPLHLAAKYGNIKVARLLLQKDAPVDAQGKNGVTPLHVAAHYDHVNVALLLLDKGAFPHATAKNGYTPLHIAAKKNQMDIATTLLEYGAKPSAESKAGFTPLHLASQEGHTDMTTLLIEHHADVNAPAKNGLSPLHLCSQEDKVNVASVLVKNGAKIDPQTKAGYTPLHVACHFGQINMIRFLLQHGADVNATTSHGYTPLHQAAQQGHTLIVNLLLEHKASPNTTTNQGQTALSIAQRLGYISVVETLKIVTETVVTTTTTTITEEKYKVVAPETMQETFMSDSEDEGGDDIEDTSLYGKPAHATHVYLPYIEGQKLLMTEDTMLGDQSFRYLTADEMKSLGDDSLPIDVTRDERGADSNLTAPLTAEEDHLTPQHIIHQEATFSTTLATDNVDLARAPVHAGKLKWKTFLVSFMVDARGGAMRGCRHSGVRVIIPPRKAPMPMRITCRYLRKEKLAYPPPLMEGEACASRILEVGPSGAKFLGPVIIEVPHFASLRGREREITILRSDNGESWREHTLEASDDAVHDVFNESFESEELTALEDLSTNRITRILTTDFPQYFAIITRIRQEAHAIGPEGGMVSSTVVPQVQAIFPEGALTKKIKVGLQAQPITPELVTKLLGNRVAVSPIVTVEPRRRKFHKSITLTIPVPQAATKGMINQYSGDAPTLRLLCSITGSTKTGGTTKAQWEDVTGSTPLTFVNDCVSFTTTVSARFWLMDCRQVNEVTKFATELYREAIHVPFMAKFVVFAKRHDPMEAQLRVFCMTDDKEDKTLESQEHFTEVAKSRDVEVLEGKPQYLEFAGNLVPVTKSGEQLSLTFQAFRENRLPFTIRVKDPHQEPMGRVAFMREPRVGRGEPPQSPICNLNIALPEADLTPVSELVTLEKKYGFVQETSLAKPELIHRADLRLSDIAKELGDDWISLALQLDLPESDINSIRSENPNDTTQQALVMLRHWLQRTGSKATGNSLEKGLRKINREDIVNHCMFNVELVTDDVEKAVAKVHLDQSGFDTFKEELGSSRDASLRREASLNGVFDEQDIMKDAESAAETSSESSDKEAHFRSETKSGIVKHAKTEVKDIEKERIFTSTTTKVVEDGPETLVQQIPTALAESFIQNLSNGQIADLSVHEEDKSEPTVATLSSEATAEMEVSSLEDKSQGETHVEKKDTSSCGLHKSLLKDIVPRPIKKFRQVKQVFDVDKKVNFNLNSRASTPSNMFLKKKIIVRRNSWPPNSPAKLNKKKKYQKLLKVRSIREPFWIDSYEWLTMKCAPETLKSAPLAHLSEFDIENIRLANYTKPLLVPYVSSFERSLLNEPYLQNKISDVLKFYFSSPCNKIPNKMNNMKNLKNRCFTSNISYEIPVLKPTNFNIYSHNDSSILKVNEEIEAKENILSSNLNAMQSINRPNILPENYTSYICYSKPQMTSYIFQEAYTPDEDDYHRSSWRSLQNNGSVISEPLPFVYRDDLHTIKQKAILADSIHDKENATKRFPFTKFLERHEKFKKPFSQQQILNNDSKICPANYLENKLPLTDNAFNNLNNHHKDIIMPKSLPIRTIPNKPPSSNQKDIPSPVQPSSSVSTQSKSNTENTNQRETSKSTQVSDSDSKGNISSSSFVSDSNVPSHSDTSKKLSQENIETHNSKSLKKKEDSKNLTKSLGDSKLKKEIKPNENSSNISNISDASELKISDQASSIIPSTVLGQAFLRSLLEKNVDIDDKLKEKPFPASVIGQTFLKTLIEQQSKIKTQELLKIESPSSSEDITKPTIEGKKIEETGKETIPATLIGQSFLKNLIEEQRKIEDTSSSKIIPATIVGQAFLKMLIEDEKNVKESCSQKVIPSSIVGQTSLKSSIEEHTSAQESIDFKKNIPANVIGQSFLKTLIQEQKLLEQHSDPSKIIPASVVGQSFLKSLIEETKTLQESSDVKQVIPADVIGQIFLKTFIENQKSIQDYSEQSQIIPASIIGQTFLKTLIEEQKVTEECNEPTKIIPASVIGQSFLKTLAEQNISVISSDPEQVIPASVIGQTFLKSLIEEHEITEEISDPKKAIPATVIGQSFLKALSENVSTLPPDSEKAISAPVIGQTFLKSLIEEQKTAKESSDSKSAIPASVIGQSFLKSLISEQKLEEQSPNPEKTIPASVIGQAFLKSLVEEQIHAEESSVSKKAIPAAVIGQSFLKTLKSENLTPDLEKTIPASVVGQTFLKSLVEEQKPVDESSNSKNAIPATVIGQSFLKSLVSEQKAEEISDPEKIIPASVIGHTFLKSLLDEQKVAEEISDPKKTIPATVIGQSFLKALSENVSTLPPDFEKTIPASVIGQTFLKSLIEEQKTAKESSDSKSVIPASVIGQSFLKSLISEQKIEEQNSSPEKTIPASVIGQAFLKSLVEEQIHAEESNVSEKAIPAAVIGQSFLKTLKSENICLNPEKTIPASVVGQTFLKSLVEEQKIAEESSDSKAAIPASVIGQSFLKTLIEEQKMAEQSTDSNKTIPATVIGQSFIKSLIEEQKSGQESSNIQKTVPASIIGQSFLKSLIEETQLAEDNPPLHEVIPASVIGQSFIKSLLEEHKIVEEPKALISSPNLSEESAPSKMVKEKLSSSDESSFGKVKNIIPSTVIGQAFLKTLNMQASEGTSTSSELNIIPSTVIGQSFLKILNNQLSNQDQEQLFSIKEKPKQTLTDNQQSLGTQNASTSKTSAIQQTEQKSKEDKANVPTSENIKGLSSNDNISPQFDDLNVIIPPPPEFSSSVEDLQALAGVSQSTDSSKEKDVPTNIIGELLTCTKLMHNVIGSMAESEGSQKTSQNK